MKDKKLRICEIFDSISGEGLNAGKPATFIRFSGCNLNCNFCDTRYHDEIRYNLWVEELSQNPDIEKKLSNKRYVIFTGGEPYIQNHHQLAALKTELKTKGTEHIEIETNGKNLDDFISLFAYEHSIGEITFSADFKMQYSENHDYYTSAFAGYQRLNKNDCIKVVVKNTDEIDVAKDISDKFKNTNILISPCFGDISPTEIAEYLVNKRYQNIRMQIQLHKILWDVNARGK